MAASGSHGRRRVSAGVLQTLTPGWTRPGGAAAIFARGRLSQAEITEHYFVDQEISKNPWTKQGRDPAGRIELALPYDGYEHFSRVARDDVARQIGTDVPSGETAIVGHLLLQDYHATNLGERLQLADRHGSVPIEVPVAPSVADHLEQLSADRQTCVARHTFQPESPAVLPAQMDIDLSDPDSLDLVSLDMAHLDPLTLDLHTEYAQQQLRAVMARITQQVSFRGELVLGISIRISVPGLARPRPAAAQGRPGGYRLADHHLFADAQPPCRRWSSPGRADHPVRRGAGSVQPCPQKRGAQRRPRPGQHRMGRRSDVRC